MQKNKQDKTAVKFKSRDFYKLISATKPRYSLLISGVTFGLISALVQLVIPQMANYLINSFKTGLNYFLVVGIVILLVVTALVSAAAGSLLGIFGENVVANLRKQLWRKLIKMPIEYFDLVKSGDLSSRLSNDTTQIKILLSNVFPSALSSILMVIGSIIMMFLMNWKMTLIVFIIFPLVFLGIRPIIKFGQKIGQARQGSLADFNASISETISEIRLVKSSNAEPSEELKGFKQINELNQIGKKEAIYDSVMPPFLSTMIMFLILGILVYGVYGVAQGTMSMGMLTSFVLYMFNFMVAVPVVGRLFSETAKAAGSTFRLGEMLKDKPEDLDKGKEVNISNKVLEAKNVSFSYVDDNPVIKDISFEAKPNTMVAFAGPSGSGKSTIFSLIERFYSPTSGSLKVDGMNIDEISLHSWRQQIGFVGQDSPMMAGTIRDNLTYGNYQEHSDEEIWRVLHLAFADQFVKEMPFGLDTEVGERGVMVSGGQRQRLAIARAFLRDPKILMFDEATASLDSESEHKVQKALVNLMKGRTTLMIAHRLATIVNADQIYFLDHGKITGSGTHEELVKKHSLYAQYVNEQFMK